MRNATKIDQIQSDNVNSGILNKNMQISEVYFKEKSNSLT